MFKQFKIAISSSILATLVACGGGGGGETVASPASVTSTSTFPLRTAYANIFLDTSTQTFSITGTVNGSAVTGSGTVTRGGATAGNFEGNTALQRTSQITVTYVINGTSIPVSTVSTVYTDSNYIPLGYSGSEYGVVQGVTNIPVSAKVNDTGIIGTITRYSSSAKTSILGTTTESFALLPDSANTALVNIIDVARDGNSNITSTETTVIRITDTGAMSYVSATVVYPNGNTITWKY